eukprot:52327_1
MKQHNKNINSKYNLNISPTTASSHPNNFNPKVGLNNLHTSSIDIYLGVNVNNVEYKHIQPIAMTASLVINNKSKDYKNKMNILINGSDAGDEYNGSNGHLLFRTQ